MFLAKHNSGRNTYCFRSSFMHTNIKFPAHTQEGGLPNITPSTSRSGKPMSTRGSRFLRNSSDSSKVAVFDHTCILGLHADRYLHVTMQIYRSHFDQFLHIVQFLHIDQFLHIVKFLHIDQFLRIVQFLHIDQLKRWFALSSAIMGSLDLEGGKVPHVVVVPHSNSGHTIPFLQFARRLASTGILTTVVVSDKHAQELEASENNCNGNYRIVPLGDKTSLELSHKEWHELVRNTEEQRMIDLLEARIREFGSPSPVCIVHDMFECWTQEVAERLHIAKHLLFVSPASALSCALQSHRWYKTGSCPDHSGDSKSRILRHSRSATNCSFRPPRTIQMLVYVRMDATPSREVPICRRDTPEHVL